MPGRAPADPQAFIEEAERASNARDLEAVEPLYAPDATLISTTNSVRIEARGTEEIMKVWRTIMGFLDRRGYLVSKELLACADGVLVNRWRGHPDSPRDSAGIEVWRFDDEGRVAEHTLDIHLDPRDERTLIARGRLLASHPLDALAFLRSG